MWTVIDTPVDQLRITEHRGEIVSIEWEPFEAGPLPDGTPRGDRDDEHAVLKEAVRQLEAYFSGTLREFDLPVAPSGTEFQHRVWAQLRAIPFGETTSYGQIAQRMGMTNAASRAVGLANGRNPIPIVVPCHRVIGADGSLTGFAGGVARKQTLLDLEDDSALF